MDLKEICKVYAKPYPELVPEKYYRALSTCGVTDFEDVNWKHALGKKVFNSLSDDHEAKLNEILATIGEDINYYLEVYLKTKQVFDFLKPACVNLVQYKALMASDSVPEDSKQILEKWKPNRDGFLDVPTYDICSSVTGRMKITSGPNILVLSKDFRGKILKSRHGKDGSLWYIDFVSLEPRVALIMKQGLSGDKIVPKERQEGLGSEPKITPPPPSPFGYPPQTSNLTNSLSFLDAVIPRDVYEAALTALGLGKEIDRNILKQIILPQLYGQSKTNTIESLEKQKLIRPEEVVDQVNDFFGIDTLRQNVFLNLQNNAYKFLRTFYGKHICPDDSRPYTLLNYYIQSTAVDIALLGFKRILDRVQSVPNASSLITPVFFVHDAMILDVHSSMEHHLEKLSRYGSKNIQGFETHDFYMLASKV